LTVVGQAHYFISVTFRQMFAGPMSSILACDKNHVWSSCLHVAGDFTLRDGSVSHFIIEL